MKIGIVGYGYVGRALCEVFMRKDHEVMINEIREYALTNVAKTFIASKERLMDECDIIFICVDTPSRQDNGGCDLTKVYTVFNELHMAWGELSKTKEGLRITKHQPIIVIKSTVIPGTLDTLRKAYPWCCSNPEFMRQGYGVEDFSNPDRIVIGSVKGEVTKKMLELYEDFDCPKMVMLPAEAELIKYLSNSFLLTKIAFSQEISRISTMLGINANKIFEGIVADRRIDQHHLDPSTGRISLHTRCLTKDMLALIQQLDMSGYDTNFLKTAYAKAVDGVSLDFKLEVST